MSLHQEQMTALHRAAMSGSDAACQVLLRAGAGSENSPLQKFTGLQKGGGEFFKTVYIYIYIYIVYITVYYFS